MNCLSPTSAAKLLGVGLLSAGLLVGCSSSKPAQPAESTTPPPSAAAEAAAKAVAAEGANLPKLVAPLQGEVTIDYTKPETKHVKDDVITTVRVKNTSNGAIAGLRMTENWYDKNGNPLAGGEDRLHTLLMAGDTATFTITTPYSPKLFSNKLDFAQVNGTVKPTLVKDIPADAAKPDDGKK
ncbi:MAG: hypothetical protein KGN76_02365 [Acidobacteriota bacterium]|nr:hypothetical protein [Acidobacteriota bacterium]